MGAGSKIEWTHHTFNPWRGCTKVSAGCANCYAETLSGRNPGTLGVWGPNGTRVVAAEAAWKEPVKWDKKAKAAGERHRVFCASLADVFEDWQGLMTNSNGSTATTQVPGFAERPATMQDGRVRLLKLVMATPHLDWLLLTKRPANILPMLRDAWMQVDSARDPNPRNSRPFLIPGNVWLGTSVENQQAADERIPHLLKVPAAVRFLSCEPLLGPVDLERVKLKDAEFPENGQPPVTMKALSGWHGGANCPDRTRIDWVIAGGESGPNARPMHPAWARSLRDQCQAAGVPFFFKQHGEWAPDEGQLCDDTTRFDDGQYMARVGKKSAGRLLDGRTWDEFPAPHGGPA